jgi:hypothetical protein
VNPFAGGPVNTVANGMLSSSIRLIYLDPVPSGYTLEF